MNLYLLLAEDPFYTFDFVKTLCDRYNVVGAGFPSGFISPKRLWITPLIYGPLQFLKTGIRVCREDLRGGVIKNHLRSQSIPIHSVKDVNNPAYVDEVKSLAPDLIISNNCPQRLGKQILATPRLGAINQHLGRLPAYRGVFPLFHALAQGEQEFGVTIHYMDTQLDNGSILCQEVLPIQTQDSLLDLYPRAFAKGTELMIQAVEAIRTNTTAPKPNGPEGKSYYSYPRIRDILKYHSRHHRSSSKAA